MSGSSSPHVASRKERWSEARFQALTRHSADIISLLDPQGRLLFNSAAAERISGFTTDELANIDTFQLMHPEEREAARKVFQEVLSTPGAVRTVQYRYRKNGGGWTWMEAVARNEIDDPEVGGVVAISRDITARKAAEEALRASEESNRAIVAALPDWLFRLDANLRLLDLATPAPSQRGALSHAFVGETIAVVLEAHRSGLPPPFPDARALVADLMKVVPPVLETGVVQGFEFKLCEAWFEARVARATSTEVLVIVRDVTEPRLAQEALRAAVVARDSLLAIVSHDLRVPLSAIVLSAERIIRKATFEHSSPLRQSLDVIARAATRMNRLIEDLLQAATIEAGAFTITTAPEEVRPLVHEAVLALEPLAAARSARLAARVAGGLPEIECDRARLLQVLSNLIGNAVKFVSEGGGSIEVLASRRGDDVLFVVSDDGEGIPEDQLPHIFDRYWKGKSEARQGAGLGLFISKGIVEASGGRLWVERHGGAGSDFCFTIPVAGSARGVGG